MPRRNTYSEDFERFWKTVWTPSRRLNGDNKSEAYQAWQKAILEGSTQEELFEGSEHWFEMQRRKSANGGWTQSPPHLCRFLRNELHHSGYEALVAEREALEEREKRQAANVTHLQPRGQTKFLREYEAKKAASG